MNEDIIGPLNGLLSPSRPDRECDILIRAIHEIESLRRRVLIAERGRKVVSEDIIERLERMHAFFTPDPISGPDRNPFVDWPQVAKLLHDAIAEINDLRLLAGDITRGESFDEIAKRVGRGVHRG